MLSLKIIHGSGEDTSRWWRTAAKKGTFRPTKHLAAAFLFTLATFTSFKIDLPGPRSERKFCQGSSSRMLPEQRPWEHKSSWKFDMHIFTKYRNLLQVFGENTLLCLMNFMNWWVVSTQQWCCKNNFQTHFFDIPLSYLLLFILMIIHKFAKTFQPLLCLLHKS